MPEGLVRCSRRVRGRSLRRARRSSGSSGCGCRAARWRCWRRRPGRPRTTISTLSRLRQVWDALGQEHDFGPAPAAAFAVAKARSRDVEARMHEARRVVLEQLREQGPTVSLARARALVFEASAGRLSADEAARLLAGWSAGKGGELLTLDGGRVTSREIRQLEQHVIDVAISAAGKEDPARPSVSRSGRPGWLPRKRHSASVWTGSSWRRSSCSPAARGGCS